MKTKIFLTIIFLSVIFQNQIFSQKFVKVKKSSYKIEEEGFKEAWKHVKKGNKLFRMNKKGAFYEALEHYLTANNYNEDNAALNYLIGISYLKTSDSKKALEFIDNANFIYGYLTDDILYWLAMAKQYNYQFDEAIDDYEEYMSSLTPKEMQRKKTKIDKRIEECESGIKLMNNPVRCFVDNLGNGVNTKAPEYSPVFYFRDSVLYFTSRRENTTGGKKNPYSRMYYEDVYTSYFKNGKWQNADQMEKPINTKHNDAAVDISPEGREICIYRGYKGQGDLYNSQFKKDMWQKPGKMKRVNKGKYRESSVSVTRDSMTLYFISDRKGGQGRQDIWMTQKTIDGSKWQKPQNLGHVVNTKYNEETVEISADGKDLYFSSKGHNSMGGYDVFVTHKNDDGTWTEPENIGYPINTPGDDVFFMLTKNEKFGYYSSNRDDSFGDKDIYQVVFLGPEKPTHISFGNPNDLIAYFAEPINETDIEKPVNIKVIQLSIVKGVVTDAFSGKPIKATLELVDNATGEVVKIVESYASTGAYTVPLPPGKDYALTAGAPDYFFHSENFTIADTSTHEVIRKDIQLQPMGIGAKIVLNNVFFDSGKAILRPESFPELNRLARILTDYKNIRVEISGHTDSRGSESSNQGLSQRRAQSVVDYILTRGVNLAQIVAMGYGESQPRADNNTASGRQLNRRVEAKILDK
ncbi:MAG: OmpA family protein [Bacteroidales bacterium]|nr:OmpA family protein [Bacteroidales bacterium]